MEIYECSAAAAGKRKKKTKMLRLLHVLLSLARSLSLALHVRSTCVLYLIGHMLPGPVHLLLLAVARMRVVPQAGLILHKLHEFHIENGIILACHARTFTNTV